MAFMAIPARFYILSYGEKGLRLLAGNGHLFFRGRPPAPTTCATSPWHEYSEEPNKGKGRYLPSSIELLNPAAGGDQPFPGRETQFGG